MKTILIGWYIFRNMAMVKIMTSLLFIGGKNFPFRWAKALSSQTFLFAEVLVDRFTDYYMGFASFYRNAKKIVSISFKKLRVKRSWKVARGFGVRSLICFEGYEKIYMCV